SNVRKGKGSIKKVISGISSIYKEGDREVLEKNGIEKSIIEKSGVKKGLLLKKRLLS
ncbi:1084_t:CDS:2, partial [Gigaspora margarita]